MATSSCGAAGAAAGSAPLLPAESRSKVLEYDSFLKGRLQPDLAKALDALEGAQAELADYLSLRAQLLAIDELGARPLKLKLDLGASFYAQAVVPDPSLVCVHIGLGFFAELSRSEALAFVAAKEAALNERVRELSSRVATIRAHVQVLLDAIAELSGHRLAAGR